MSYTPTTSAGMIEANSSNIIFLTPIWKLTSRDGQIAAYSGHTRSCVGRQYNPRTVFTFGGVDYKPSVVTNTRDVHKIGLQPNSTQITGLFDSIVTRREVEGGRWKLATAVFEYVSYMDLTLGSTGKIAGYVGQISIQDPFYQMEVISNSGLLQQLIGEMTSPTDRNTLPAGVLKSDWEVTRDVVSSADRRHLVINGTAKPNGWFDNGVIYWATGANSKYPGAEIKTSLGNTIELQLPMPEDIAGSTPGPADSVVVLAGYDGSRSQARDKFSDAIDMNAEPDLPGLKVPFSYPE